MLPLGKTPLLGRTPKEEPQEETEAGLLWPGESDGRCWLKEEEQIRREHLVASREDMNRFAHLWGMLTRPEQHWAGVRWGRVSGPRWHHQALFHHSASPYLPPEAGRGLQCLLLHLVLLGGRKYYNFSTMQHPGYALRLLKKSCRLSRHSYWEVRAAPGGSSSPGERVKKQEGRGPRGRECPQVNAGASGRSRDCSRGNRDVCMMPGFICASRVSSNEDGPLWWVWQHVERVGNVTRLSKLWAEICDLAQKEWKVAGALASDVPCIEVEYRKKRNKATERSKAQVCREKVEESERKKIRKWLKDSAALLLWLFKANHTC